MEVIWKIFGAALLQAALIVVLIGGVLGLVFGAMLIFDSARFFRINETMGRWISTRAWSRALDVSRKTDLQIYRFHRLTGIALAACALSALYVLILRYRAGPVLHLFRDLARPAALELIVEAARVSLIVGNVFLLAVGFLLAFRPDLVRALERWADRHYSSREYTRPLEEMRDRPDRFVREHPKLVGWLLLIAGVYVLVNLGVAFLL